MRVTNTLILAVKTSLKVDVFIIVNYIRYEKKILTKISFCPPTVFTFLSKSKITMTQWRYTIQAQSTLYLQLLQSVPRFPFLLSFSLAENWIVNKNMWFSPLYPNISIHIFFTFAKGYKRRICPKNPDLLKLVVTLFILITLIFDFTVIMSGEF